MDKILNGNDYAKTNGFSSLREMLRARDYRMFDTPFHDTVMSGKPVMAFVSFGIWIAICECNGAEYVAPGEPFYCQSCGNNATGGAPRPVEFPADAKEIESELLKRPVIVGAGRNEFERTQRQRAAINDERGWLSRTWLPSETLSDLKKQNKVIPTRRKR